MDESNDEVIASEIKKKKKTTNSKKNDNPNPQEVRIQSLRETLRERRLEFEILSKEYFEVHQDYLSKSSTLKDLKLSATKASKNYVDIVTEMALQEADYEYKKELLLTKSDVASNVCNEKYSVLQNLRQDLESVLQTYSDTRKNLKKYQSEISSVTDDARIGTLNMVAFCRYSQSVISNEVRKMPRRPLTSKAVSEAKQLHAKNCHRSLAELSKVYFNCLSRYRREEALLTSRLNGPLESDDDEASMNGENANNSKPYSRDAKSNLYSRPRFTPGTPNKPAAPTAFTSSQTPSDFSSYSTASNQHSSDEAMGFLPRLASATPATPTTTTSTTTTAKRPTSPTKRPVSRTASADPPQKAKLSKLQTSLNRIFDLSIYESTLQTLMGIDEPPSTATPHHHNHRHQQRPTTTHHHSTPSPLDLQHQLLASLRVNTLLVSDENTPTHDARLVQLTQLVCSLEGKYRELSCIKENLDQHLMKQSYMVLLLLQDLHLNLDLPIEPLLQVPPDNADGKEDATHIHKSSADSSHLFYMDPLATNITEMQKDYQDNEKARDRLLYETHLLLKLNNISTII